MARSDVALHHARRAYELAHVAAAARGLAIAGLVVVLAFGLHRSSVALGPLAAALAVALAAFAWRGGPWRRGAFAGVLAGLPPLLAPALVFALQAKHCAACSAAPAWPCVAACFASSTIVGAAVGWRARTDAAPRRYALAAIVTALLAGLLGCGSTGLGGALGIAIGLSAGLTGYLVVARPASS